MNNGPVRDEHGNLVPRKSYAIGNHIDGVYVIAVFRREDCQEELNDEGLDEDGLAAALTGWTEFSRGVGRMFGSSPTVRVGKRNVVVRQFRGLDV